MFVFKHALALIIALCVVSCRAMSFKEIISNLTQKEVDELQQFGVKGVSKGNDYQFLEYDHIPLTTTKFTDGRECGVYLVNPVFFLRLHDYSPKIQYLVREACRSYVFNKMDGCDDNVKNCMIHDFELKFKFCAPIADQFLLSHASSSSSLEIAGQGAILIMLIGSMYGFLMQDRKSFEGTLIIGGIVFPVIVLFYGFMAGK